MRLLPFRRSEDSTDSVEETPDEAVQSETGDPVSVSSASTSTNAVELSTDADTGDQSKGARRRIPWSRVVAYGLLPVVAVALAGGAGYLKWRDGTARQAQAARAESVQAAVDGTVALLSYRADTVDKDLNAAKSRMTGSFLEAYTKLTQDVVIPGAKQKQISAVATVPAAGAASATASHAVVLVFVNQTVIVGQSAPTSTASSVRVTLDKVNGHWLISQFEPV
jgi:Mce-associated membrane protein